MGFGLRIYFIDEDDGIKRIPLTRFNKIRDRHPREAFPEYKYTRVRYAEIILNLENRKPTSIERIVYSYLQFDAEGKAEEAFLDAEKRLAFSMMPAIALPDGPENVIHASDRFAQKRFKDKFTWTPSPTLEQRIFKKAFE